MSSVFGATLLPTYTHIFHLTLCVCKSSVHRDTHRGPQVRTHTVYSLRLFFVPLCRSSSLCVPFFFNKTFCFDLKKNKNVEKVLRVRACELFHHVFVSLYVTFSLAGLWSCLKGKSFILFCSFWGVFYWCSHLFSYTVPGAQTPKLVADSQCDLAESRRRSQFSQKFIPLSLRRGLLLPIQLKSRERRPPSLPGFACLFVCCRHNDTYIYRRYSLPPVVQTLRVFICTLGLCFSSFRLSSRALYRGNFTALLCPFPDCAISP